MTMRILALDHGTKRIGVAISDELQVIAQPLEFIPTEPLQQAFDRIKKIVSDYSAGLVLVGMPRNMDGSYGPAAEKVRVFINSLAPLITVPIKTWDERLTTAQAQRVLIQGNTRRSRRKEVVDQMAAAILLQSYLDTAAQNPARNR